MGDREVEEVRYRAFLSYSHRDAAAAARLHRRLEAYRVPRRLAGRETPRGPVPARLWPIFRDREELPAATDLSQTVREALAQSGALIILCSPHATASLWVAEEIRVFRELHPDRPVLAAILEGDPPDCFPGILRASGDGHEPLATDLRRDKDGRRLGVLKLVAGITGLGLDDLVQRDAARRVRRVTAITVGAVMAVLIMAVLVLMAIRSRHDAERQRGEAEGLVRFMLTDLREELRGVGRLDVMDAVNRRALTYYDREGSDGTDSARAMQGRVIQAIGENLITRGDLSNALVEFRRALALTGDLIAKTPNDPEIIFAHAQSEYWVGRVYELRADWPAALAHYDRYARAAERLVAIAPDNPDYIMEMGYGLMNRGVVRLRSSQNPAAARALFERAADLFGGVARMGSGNLIALREQINAYASIAATYYAQRQWLLALGAYRQQYELSLRLLAADPSNKENQFRLAIAERAVARLSQVVGQREPAGRLLSSAYARMSRLVTIEPGNVEWRLTKSRIECDVLLGATYSAADLDHARARRNIAETIGFFGANTESVSDLRQCLSH